MAGLINDAAQGETQSDEATDKEGQGAGESGQGAGGSIDVQKVRGAMKLPPELQDAYQRVVLAGSKFMFSKETHNDALQALQQGQGPIAQRLGNAIVGLLLMLFEKSNRTMPPQVLIPAGVDLLTQAAEFLQKSGAEKISPAEVGDALAVMISTLMQKFGGDPQKIQQAFDPNQPVPDNENAEPTPDAETGPGEEEHQQQGAM